MAKKIRFLLFFTSLIPSFGFSQTPLEGLPAGTPPASKEGPYQFESTTVWGKVKVAVWDTTKGFRAQVESDSDISGWILKGDEDGKVLSKGSLSPTNRFQLEAQTPFRGAFRMILYLDSDDQEAPIVIKLSASKNNKTGNTLAEGLEDYQDNPEHPYHAMVKNFYDQAVESYSKGDNLHALDCLKKAGQLDPLQPQVQELMDKIQGPSVKAEKTVDPLEDVKQALRKGQKEEALAKVMDYLDENPDDEEALALKDEIEGHEHSPKPVKRPVVKAKKLPGENTPAPQTDQDLKAKADQAYNLGLDSYRRGDLEAAKKFWEETLEIEPAHVQAQRNLERLKEEHPDLK